MRERERESKSRGSKAKGKATHEVTFPMRKGRERELILEKSRSEARSARRSGAAEVG